MNQLTHRFLSEVLYIVMMNEVNNDRNTNSYTSYNLRIVYDIYRRTMDAIEHYTQDIFSVSYPWKI